MKAARVPAGPILDTADLLREPQFVARGMFERAAPPPQTSPVKGGAGAAGSNSEQQQQQYVVPAITPVLSATPGRTRWAGPALGSHTDEVLSGELGLGAEELARLRASGVIA
jgi:crotonobetainyl-CoA:carnitine CoA-transferase CaiB-like acyl-CoA transferase